MWPKRCNDCGEQIEPYVGGIMESESAVLGQYYKGPLICYKCCNIRYEKATAVYEANRIIAIEVDD